MTLTDDASSLMSSQCLFIGKHLFTRNGNYELTFTLAGMCIQEPRQREYLIELIDICQRRSGWPTKSLSEELKSDWEGATVV